MKQRIITSIFGIALIFVVNFYGGVYLKLFGVALTLIGLYEYFLLYNNIERSFMSLVMLSNILIFFTNANIHIKFMLFFILLFTFAIIKSFKNQVNSNDIVYSLFSFTYISIPIYLLILLRDFENGKILIWLPYLICWATDTFAYFIGITFGKRRIWSNISPKKSIEGFFGGMVGGVLALFFYLVILAHQKLDYNGVILGIILGIALSIIAQVGDLFASMLKREHNRKDFGFILPGHGGVLDRFDSMLMVAPIVFMLSYFGIF